MAAKTYPSDTVATIAGSCAYGENRWQTPAELYRTSTDPLGIPSFLLVAGSPPSYNNFCDIDRLLQTMTHIVAGLETNIGAPNKFAVVLGAKHGNCCGAGVQEEFLGAIRKMLDGDPRAIFGGVVMVNFPINKDRAEVLLHYGMPAGKRRLLDCIVAPGFESDAMELLQRKEGKCRLLTNPHLGRLSSADLDTSLRRRQVRGGFLTQPNYTFVLDLAAPYIKRYAFGTERKEHWRDLALAWAVGSTSNSNTITLVRGGKLLGNAVGQQDRVGSAELAVKRAKDAGHRITGAVAYSDSFFPFPDGPKVLIDEHVGAIFATSGSVNDQQIIDQCVDARVPLYMAPDEVARGFYWH